MRLYRKTPTKGETSPVLKVDTTAIANNKSVSLGVGSFTADGVVAFNASTSVCTTMSVFSSNTEETLTIPRKHKKKALRRILSTKTAEKMVPPSVRDLLPSPAQLSDRILRPVAFERIKVRFIRVADLEMSETSHSAANAHDEVVPHFHHASMQPPPGVDNDPSELWVAIDDGDGSFAPIAPYAIGRLADVGKRIAMDQNMWTADRKTDKLLKTCESLNSCVWQDRGCVTLPPRGTPLLHENEVMVWSGNFKHGLYGSDLPAVRAAGIVNMSAKSLATLLLDSDRVKEYNAMSLGRTEIMVMPGDLDKEGPFGKSVTKVLRSESKPPLLRKVLQFESIIHAKELEDGSGYLIVTRAVTQADQGVFDPNILRSEILLGVNVLLKVEGDEKRCLMINVNHIRSPMVPMMVAKKIGLSAASNFIHDIRALC